MADEMVLDSPEVEIADQTEVPDESTELAEDTPAEEGDESEHEGEGEEQEDPAEGEEEPAPATPDGRKLPDAIKKALSTVKAVDPATAKILKSNYYENQEVRAAWGTPAEAVAAKAMFDEIGGKEGIQEIESERQEWHEIDEAFAEGKPEFVKGLAETNPEAFLKVAPHVLNEFATRAPEQYAYYTNKVTLNTMSNLGLTTDALAAAYERYKDNPQAQSIIAEMHNALYGLGKNAAEFEQKRTDPREEALKQKETQFEQRRRADFETGVETQAKSYLASKIQPEIDRIVAGRKVDPDAMKGYQDMVNREVEKRLGAIPGFSEKLEAYYRTGDSKKSVDYVTAQYNRILPEAAKVIAPFLRNIAPAGKKPVAAPVAGSARPSEPGTVTLKEMPTWDQLDPNWRNQSNATAELAQGRAVLKNGKRATGW